VEYYTANNGGGAGGPGRGNKRSRGRGGAGASSGARSAAAGGGVAPAAGRGGRGGVRGSRDRGRGAAAGPASDAIVVRDPMHPDELQALQDAQPASPPLRSASDVKSNALLSRNGIDDRQQPFLFGLAGN
jgi:hypothetical protein